MEKLDRFSQLVEDLETGKLTLTHIQIAIRSSLRSRKDLPEGIKDILSGRGDGNAGIIYQMFRPIQDIVGALELAYRRGKDFRKDV